MCPSYLKDQQKARVKSLAGQGSKPSLARSWNKFTQWIDDPTRTPVDVAYTFDATLLHELTHAIPNAATVDSAGGGNSDSYGWKSCTRMSSAGGTKNADSFALFGLCARMISPNNGATAKRPMSDGSLQVLTGTTTKQKRDTGLGLDYKLAPRVVEVYSTLTTLIRRDNSTSIIGTGLPSSSSSSGGTGVSSSSSSGTGVVVPPPVTSSTDSSSYVTATLTTGSSTITAPITVITASLSGTTSEVTYVATTTSSDSSSPTVVAWMCFGDLCDTSSSCIIPLFCGSQGGSGASWGLCCGWAPVIPSGGTISGGGPQPGPPGSDDNNNSQTSDSTSDSTTSTSTDSSSSCSTITTSACDVSTSIFTPDGQTTLTTSTTTVSCSTTTACDASITGSSTTETAEPTSIDAAPSGDNFNQYDSFASDWYAAQQSVLSLADADDTDPYITWSSDENYVSYDPSSTGTAPGTAPASTSATLTGTAPSMTGTAPATTTPPPICSEGNNELMGFNNEPSSWCFCGGRGPFSTIPGSTTSYCAFPTLPTETISLTSHSTSVDTRCTQTS